MGNLILLPTGQVLCLNGAGTGRISCRTLLLATQLKYPGVAGYGNDSWAIGQSYADHPILQPVVYNSSAPAGSQWSRDGLPASAVPRMYHSTATLLPDGEGAVIVFRLDRYSNESPGSVLVAGSNPNSDYVDSGIPYPTEYRLEKFYPAYFKQRRPSPTGIPNSLRYGGPFFNLSLSSSDLFEDAGNVKHSKVVVMRTGFSTHTMVRTKEPPLMCLFQMTSTHRIWDNDLSNLRFLTLRTRTVQEFSIVATFHPTQPSSRQALLVSHSSCLLLSTPE